MATAFDTSARELEAAERAIREDLAACYRLAHMFKMTDLVATHISARLPGPGERILINPFGFLFNEVTASNLVEVSLEGKVLSPGGVINPAGYLIHSTIHAAREDVVCVMHTHTAAGVAVSAQENGLLPISQQALLVGRRLAYHDYEGVALIEDERVTLKRDIADKEVLILRNHGLLTTGRTVGEAFWLMLQTQRACEIQLAAMSGGAPLRLLDDRIQDLVYEQTYNYGGQPNGALDWIALRRELDRVAPDYRD
ncbi:MAG TPA: class II aldolase/adducin family protein [Novosphingobium sp.]